MTPAPHFYVMTAIYYANAAPHIGHAYEVIGADVIARFHKLLGEDVFFLTGTDEHGIKVEKTAAKNNQSPQAYVDTVAQSFKESWQFLNIDYSRFVRTTEKDHYETVAKMWKRLEEKGDIYKASYTGLYCSGCETFLLPRDLTPEGLCPNHLTAPEPVEEENWFLKLTKYRDAILNHIETNPDFIVPAFRRNEVIKMLEDLQDISVSRARRSVTWGIPVPDDADQLVYVWIDALSNYLTGIGWAQDDPKFKTFWPPSVHVIGKDILRFHSIYWPAMLLAADLPLPQHLLVHGFITISETKISKSIGNVISAQDLAARFELENADPIRYYMMATTGFGQDGSYTEDDFKLRINADLANNLGNLLNRSLNMLNKYCDGQIPAVTDHAPAIIEAADRETVKAQYTQFQFNEALQTIMTLVDKTNKLVNDAQPWTLHKEGKLSETNDVLFAVMDSLRQVAIMLSPVVPSIAQEAWKQLGYVTEIVTVNWSHLENNPIPVGQQTALGSPLLPRLDSEIVGADKKK